MNQPSQPDAAAWHLVTARTGFGVWTPEDLPRALMLWGDPRVTALIDARGRLTETQVRERLSREIATREAHGVQYWPVFALQTGEFLGCCGLRPYRPAERLYELGVHLRPAFWGRGLATETARAVITYAFGPLGLPALFAGHNPNNHASSGLLRKLGFRHTHDEYYPPTGLMHPSYLLTHQDITRRESPP